MPVSIRQSGSKRDIANVYVRDGGTLRTIRKIYVRDSGTLRTVYRRAAFTGGPYTLSKLSGYSAIAAPATFTTPGGDSETFSIQTRSTGVLFRLDGTNKPNTNDTFEILQIAKTGAVLMLNRADATYLAVSGTRTTWEWANNLTDFSNGDSVTVTIF